MYCARKGRCYYLFNVFKPIKDNRYVQHQSMGFTHTVFSLVVGVTFGGVNAPCRCIAHSRNPSYSVPDERYVYSTLAACQKACDERNKNKSIKSKTMYCETTGKTCEHTGCNENYCMQKTAVNFMMVMEQTPEEKFKMYMEQPKEKLIEMLFENQRLVKLFMPTGVVYAQGEPKPDKWETEQTPEEKFKMKEAAQLIYLLVILAVLSFTC